MLTSAVRTGFRASAGSLGWAALGLALLLTAGAASQDVDLAVSTPPIQRLRASMRARAAALGNWKANGYVGEGAEGLLAVHSLQGVSIAQKKEIQDGVALENADRNNLYREILKANRLGDDAAGRIMAAAARQRRVEASPNEWVQDPKDGRWMQKKDLRE